MSYLVYVVRYRDLFDHCGKLVQFPHESQFLLMRQQAHGVRLRIGVELRFCHLKAGTLGFFEDRAYPRMCILDVWSGRALQPKSLVHIEFYLTLPGIFEHIKLHGAQSDFFGNLGLRKFLLNFFNHLVYQKSGWDDITFP